MSEKVKQTRTKAKKLEDQSTPELLELLEKIKKVLLDRKKVHENEAKLIPEL